MKQLLTLLCTILTLSLFGQSILPGQMVEAIKIQGHEFEKQQLLKPTNLNRSALQGDELEVYQALELDRKAINRLNDQRTAQINLVLPAGFRNEALEVELVQVDIFSSDFQVTRASDGRAANVDYGLHYRGIVKGHPNSIAAISIFEDEVMGVFSTSEDGNLVLGKLKNQEKHILYPDKDIQGTFPLDCATPDDGVGYNVKDLAQRPGRALSDCVRLYFEADHDIFQDKGGVQQTTNYVTGIYNQVATIYANENINTVVSEIVVWDQPSPYSSNSSSGMLNDFQAFHNNSSWNGDLGHLLSYQASGGIAAGFNGICNNNRDQSLCFSSITSSFNIVPTYSWTIMVVTHEFGHLFGSRHTHACVWNGNNTAIDGCSGSTEGSCSLPGIPSSGGTIMSYCHLTSVGINFNNGFGPQPGDAIRNDVANGNCLIPCGPPTCDDGIQNGNETGVDCGGPDCPACPTCFDGIQNGDEVGVDCGGPDCPNCPCSNNLQLTIVLDNYPEETSWEITDGSGSVWFSGGTYGNQPDGSTVIENACLPDGCFTFTIFDSFGDGICCAYGNGSYVLTNTDNGSVVASGGSFGSSEATNFCVTSATCFDGIQNGDEEGVDCGGSFCPPCVVGCQDNEVTLAITFDAIPGQVTWDFVDAAGNVVASGGNYTQNQSGDTVLEPVCLPDGCYDFTMYDSGFNGLCCRFGNGNYQLTDDVSGDMLASGAVYGAFETTPICVGNPVGPTCNDGIQNGDEEGVDCGGSFCPPCDPTPTCNDGIQNGDEEGVDCGGSFCPPCNPTPTCNDGIQNGDEEGVDCGGSFCPACPTCDDGIQNGDEEGVDCGGSFCPACPTCDDGIQNGDEEGVDCGGSFCPACPTCDDGIQNGDEEGVDCGGSFCPACPTCDDGIQNGDEEGVDCGGTFCQPCVSCTDGVQNGDEEGVDCGGSFCLPCFTCDDGIQNGDEEGIDCGGSICPICPGTCNYDLTLTLNFDFLPNQTSWEITNVLGNVNYAGGPYINESGGSTLVIDGLCFDAGCYTLTMFDSGGDGMCCRFGTGSYQLTDANGTVLASGGDFDASESTTFCLGNGSLGLLDVTPAVSVSNWDLHLFPNPASEILNIQYKSDNTSNIKLRCVSLTGQLMDQQNAVMAEGRSATQLDISSYPAGIYIIHITDEEGKMKSKRFTVLR